MNDSKDNIYQQPQAEQRGQFKFDDRVASVFADMIARSVPGYEQILGLLPTLVRQFQQPNANYYDLGCSLGAGMLAMGQGLSNSSSLIGIDNSQAMLTKAKPLLQPLEGDAKADPSLAQQGSHRIELRCEDLSDSDVSNAAIVLMNFTLQFIVLDKREHLINKIHRGLLPGGVLVLSEKIDFKDSSTKQVLIDIHHQYKFDQGYSKLEIAQKRDAIEQVLLPETLSMHTSRLESAGFSVVVPWVQNLQFISILAIK